MAELRVVIDGLDDDHELVRELDHKIKGLVLQTVALHRGPKERAGRSGIWIDPEWMGIWLRELAQHDLGPMRKQFNIDVPEAKG